MVIVRLMEVALDVALGLKAQVDSLGNPVQVYCSGKTVWELEPLVTTNGGVLVLPTVIFTAAVVWPCATESAPLEPRFDVRVKLSVVWVTANATEELLCLVVDAPLTTIVALVAPIFGGVETVSCAVPLPPLTLDGLQLQVVLVGRPEQLRLTVSVNPFCGVIVTVVVVVAPAATVAGLKAPAVSEKVGIVANQTCASA